MDNSRANQIARFRGEMLNPSLPYITRKRAARAFYRIKRQLKDPLLAKMRYEYMRADSANDDIARLDIGDRLQTYMFRKYKQRI